MIYNKDLLLAEAVGNYFDMVFEGTGSNFGTSFVFIVSFENFSTTSSSVNKTLVQCEGLLQLLSSSYSISIVSEMDRYAHV